MFDIVIRMIFLTLSSAKPKGLGKNVPVLYELISAVGSVQSNGGNLCSIEKQAASELKTFQKTRESETEQYPTSVCKRKVLSEFKISRGNIRLQVYM